MHADRQGAGPEHGDRVATSEGGRRRGSALVLEGIVILASILVAFLLEGWRADRELARELTQELESVHRELERNRELVVAELTVLDRLTSSAGSLLAALTMSPQASTVPVTDTIALLGTSWSPTIDPSLGAVEALIGSGRLAQVPNPQLRQGLAGLRDQFEDALEEQLMARAVFSNEIFSLTRDRLDYRVFGELIAGLSGSADAGALSQESMSVQSFASFGTVDYPNSFSIRNALEMRRQWYMAAQDELVQLRVLLDDLIAVMEDELADR
jgi:hypothetical protein